MKTAKIEESNNIVIRKAVKEDVDDIVRIHVNAFDGFFLTSLGETFLKFYYECFLRNPETFTLVASHNNDVIGFSAATAKCKGFNSRLIKKNIFAFGILSIKMLFTEPKSLLRLVKNLTKKSDDVEDNEEYAELYSIGVSKDAQKMGIGRRLLYETESELKKDGVNKVSLTTDFYNNDYAIAFYRSLGYKTLYEFITYPNRKMYRLIKDINTKI